MKPTDGNGPVDVNARLNARQAALEHFRAISRDYNLEPRLGIPSSYHQLLGKSYEIQTTER